jgi:HAD superfamily hydrolase (TIGR01490 family)
MAGPAIAAFWDLDGTLIEGAVTGYLVRHLVARGRMQKRRLAVMAAYNLLYKLNLLTPAGIHRAAADLIVGWPMAEAERVMAEVMDLHVHRRVYAEAVERIRWHRDQGHVQAVVTGGPEFAARLLAERVGLTHVLGSRTPVRDGRIAADFSPADLCFGEAKVSRVRAFAREHGVQLSQSYAYSDSRSDLPMLREVGFAHAVNPQWLLQRRARREGIPVLRFRERMAW